ncbi:hypothetical protein GV67_06835 [Pseudorhizobium pelagicum]|nr:hypothetical protein GV67_06835 [Pseudorhizobium pelagicum]
MAQAIERGPTPYLDGVVRWRLCDLAQWIREEFRISVSQETLGREVRAMGIASSLLAQDIMLRMPKRLRLLKNFPAAVAKIVAGPAWAKCSKSGFRTKLV